jgi:hypothetical protein
VARSDWDSWNLSVRILRSRIDSRNVATLLFTIEYFIQRRKRKTLLSNSSRCNGKHIFSVTWLENKFQLLLWSSLRYIEALLNRTSSATLDIQLLLFAKLKRYLSKEKRLQWYKPVILRSKLSAEKNHLKEKRMLCFVDLPSALRRVQQIGFVVTCDVIVYCVDCCDFAR